MHIHLSNRILDISTLKIHQLWYINFMNSNPITTFYIIRHGQSHGNIDPTNPHPNPELTEIGRAQVATTSQKFTREKFDLIVHSDYIRAIQTAEILNAERKLELKEYPTLRERDYGSFYNSVPPTELKKLLTDFVEKLEQLPDEEYWNYKHFPDMESEQEALDRFTTTLKKIAAEHPGKKILVVGHGNLMRNFLNFTGYANHHELPPMSFANAGYIVTKTNGAKFMLEDVFGAEKREVKEN